MRRLVALTLVFIACFVFSFHAQADETNHVKLYIDITSEDNLMFSTYAITITLDGTEIGSVANGKVFTYMAEVLVGEHSLIFCKAGSTSPQCTKKISISDDMTYACVLSHSSSAIEIKKERIEDNVGGATLEVVDVTGMVLSEAFSKLSSIGFSNLREEPYSSIWNKKNWIVTAQGIAPGTIVDKNEFIRLDCISLDDYFSNAYVGKQVNEIQELAAASGFALRFENESWSNMDSQVDAMDQETKGDWVATKARQYGGADKTAVVTIKYTGEVVTPEASPTPVRTMTVVTYDLDKDLVVVQCERDTNKTTMYHVTFAESDSNGNFTNFYTFSSIINPREMGKQFNAIGDLPTWFYVGATVHVRANLIRGALSDCTVTEATGTTNATQAPQTEGATMPAMAGTSLDTVLGAAEARGLTRAFNDEDFGHGTKRCSLTNSSNSLTLNIIYSTGTKEVLCGSIITSNAILSSDEQKAFINAMAGVLCPESNTEDVTNWVKANVGGSAETTIDGFIYEVGVGTNGNLLYNAGEHNWEEWELSFN